MTNVFLDPVPGFKSLQYSVKKFYEKYHDQGYDSYFFLNRCYEDLRDVLLCMVDFIDLHLQDTDSSEPGYLDYLGDFDCATFEVHVNFALRFAIGETSSELVAKGIFK